MKLLFQDKLNDLNRSNPVTIDSFKHYVNNELHVTCDIKHINTLNENNELYLISNKFNTNEENLSDEKNILNRELRSLVIAIKNGIVTIVSYTHETMININYNDFIVQKESMTDLLYVQMYEGTHFAMFYYENRWFYYTRKSILDKSYFASKNITFDMLLKDSLSALNITRDFLENNLDKNITHNFIIVHHLNKYVRDYSNVFNNEKYNKLFYINIFNDLPKHIQIEKIKTFATIDEIDVSHPFLVLQYDSVRETYKYYKITTKNYKQMCIRRNETPNIWLGLLKCYIDNDNNNGNSYTVEEYANDFNINLTVDDNNCYKFLKYICSGTNLAIFDIVNYFTEFNKDGSFTKINCDEFNLITSKTLKKIIAKTQQSFKKGKLNQNSGFYFMKRENDMNNIVDIFKNIVTLHRLNNNIVAITDQYIDHVNYIIKKIEMNDEFKF